MSHTVWLSLVPIKIRKSNRPIVAIKVKSLPSISLLYYIFSPQFISDLSACGHVQADVDSHTAHIIVSTEPERAPTPTNMMLPKVTRCTLYIYWCGGKGSTVAQFNFIAIIAAISMAIQYARKRLYRSHKDKIIAGICGGLSDYFDVDPVIVRALFVVLTFVSGVGLLLYMILWIVVPREGGDTMSQNKNAIHTHGPTSGNSKSVYSNVSTSASLVSKERRTGRIIVAFIAILIGVVALFSNLFSVNLLRLGVVWPLFLIFVGLYFIFKEE